VIFENTRYMLLMFVQIMFTQLCRLLTDQKRWLKLSRDIQRGDCVTMVIFGPDVKIWSRGCSTRYLCKEKHLGLAIEYVLYGQGDELFAFE